MKHARPLLVTPRITLLLALLVVAMLAPRAQAADKPMNVLILYADDLGYGDVASQNPKGKIPTPNLDRLAASGVRFTDGHSSSGICTPSRYALLTGRHHWRDFHGIVGAMGKSVFKPERLTLPEMLKEKGYATAAIGKWHLGWDWNALRKPAGQQPKAEKPEPAKKAAKGKKRRATGGNHFAAYDWTKRIPDGPLAHGFDYYFGDTVINFPPYAWIENDRMAQIPDTMKDESKWKKIKEGRWECRPGPMVTGWDPYLNIPVTTKKGVDYIKKQKGTGKPWFLYFAFPSPHAPIIPNDKFDGKSKAGPYGDFVYETDDACGQLLRAIEESGQADNTIVIFSADNGPEKYAYARDQKFDHWSAAPFRGLKRDIYEGGHHVPFIVRWPGVTKAGGENHALVSQIDIMATLAAKLGYRLPNDAAEDSHNLLPLLQGKVDKVREHHVHNTSASKWAIRHGEWNLIVGKDGYHSGRVKAWETKHKYDADDKGPVELYNIKDDIGQRHNLAAKHPDKVKAMTALLQKIRKQGHSAPRLAKRGQ